MQMHKSCSSVMWWLLSVLFGLFSCMRVWTKARAIVIPENDASIYRNLFPFIVIIVCCSPDLLLPNPLITLGDLSSCQNTTRQEPVF
jgi:hypothetical protein